MAGGVRVSQAGEELVPEDGADFDVGGGGVRVGPEEHSSEARVECDERFPFFLFCEVEFSSGCVLVRVRRETSPVLRKEVAPVAHGADGYALYADVDVPNDLSGRSAHGLSDLKPSPPEIPILMYGHNVLDMAFEGPELVRVRGAEGADPRSPDGRGGLGALGLLALLALVGHVS